MDRFGPTNAPHFWQRQTDGCLESSVSMAAENQRTRKKQVKSRWRQCDNNLTGSVTGQLFYGSRLSGSRPNILARCSSAPWAAAHKVARITIAICFHRRGGADGFTSHTSPHGDQPQPLIQGGAIFRGLATKRTIAGDFQTKGFIAACIAVGRDRKSETQTLSIGDHVRWSASGQERGPKTVEPARLWER